MSDPKATLLVLGAGCAAMAGMAAAVFSASAFFTDPNTIKAEAFQVPARVVKTVAITAAQAEKGPSVRADTSSTASVKPAIKERSALHRASPRWARATGTSAATPAAGNAIAAAYAEDLADRRDLRNSSAFNSEHDPFAMIVPSADNAEPSVQLAGIVPVVPAPAPREELRQKNAAPRSQANEAASGKALSASATMTDAANMRAAARSGSAVLMVVPDGAKVSIAPGCEQWCEISYNGQRGYVYKDFVSSGRTAAKPKAKARDEARTVSTDGIEKTVYSDDNFLSSDKKAERQAADKKNSEPSAEAAKVAKKVLNEPSMR